MTIEEKAIAYCPDDAYPFAPAIFNKLIREAFIAGCNQTEKDMKERFIRFVHEHYPINYIGWVQDFQKAMEDEK